MKQDRKVLSVKAKPEATQREHCDKVAKSLATQRTEEEDEWHSIADFSGYGNIPSLMKTSGGKSRPRMRQLIDSHPILSFRTIEGGMYSGLSSPNRPWIRFGFLDEELSSYQPAHEYLDELTRIVLRMFDASNFYQAARQNYREMSRFGPACGIMTEHWREVAPTMALPIGTYWLGMDDAFKIDTLVRDCPMTVDQVVKKFVGRPGGEYDWSAVSTQVKNWWDSSNYQTIINVRQLIEPAGGPRFASTLWDDKDDRKDHVLEAKHYNEQPFWGPRWDVKGYSLYGRGVGHDALADMRELALQAKRSQQLTDRITDPATYGPAKDIDMRPGAHTYVADMSQAEMVKPIYVPEPGAIERVEAKIERLYNKIDRLTYADLFMAITNMPGVQPRNVEELIKRDEEKLTQIGPVVEMVNDDMLPIAVKRMLGIARRGNLLPPAPEELQGRELKIEFVSVLAQAQKMLSMSTTERTIGFVGSLGQVFGPDVLDKIDPDVLVDDYAERAGIPAKAVRDEKDVASFREQRRQKEQMAQMAAMAKPAADATQAAQNIADMSKTPAVPA